MLDSGSFASGGDVLAGEAATDNVGAEGFGFIGADVVMDRDVRPVPAEHLLTKALTLDKLYRLKAANDSLSGVAEAAYAGKQIKKPQHCID